MRRKKKRGQGKNEMTKGRMNERKKRERRKERRKVENFCLLFLALYQEKKCSRFYRYILTVFFAFYWMYYSMTFNGRKGNH